MHISNMISLCSGNPGALTVLGYLKYHRDIVNICIILKQHKITGSKMWELYSDKCCKDLMMFAYTVLSYSYSENDALLPQESVVSSSVESHP
jgi:predicted PolB exonuclease-like 3'-5' exonuclease